MTGKMISKSESSFFNSLYPFLKSKTVTQWPFLRNAFATIPAEIKDIFRSEEFPPVTIRIRIYFLTSMLPKTASPRRVRVTGPSPPDA